MRTRGHRSRHHRRGRQGHRKTEGQEQRTSVERRTRQ